ncbi:MAG: class I SAM-dependent methyltransferase [Caulobacteraceae bacterium]|nr:class I SAM-dependent methyltransferase [Caulobacteraceae bacterium]
MSGPTGPRFGLQADLYRRLRPEYPDAIFQRLAAACGDRLRLCGELGAGSGQATTRLLEMFDRVVAVEPDPDMAALIDRDPRLEVRVEWAEQARFDEPVDALVAATAFHWMDARAVCALARRSLRPGGVFMPFGYGPFRFASPAAAAALSDREYGFWRPWMDRRLVNWRHYADLVEETGLAASVEPFEIVFERAYAPEDAAGLLLTTSYASAVSRERPGYARDYIQRVVRSAEGQPVTIRFELMGCIARF